MNCSLDHRSLDHLLAVRASKNIDRLLEMGT